MDIGNDSSLQALLRFAIQNTKSEDAPNTSAFTELDPEKKKFLETALKSMTVDVIEEFEKAISALECKSTCLAEKKNSLNLIRDYIDDIDFANNFVKIGGAKTIQRYLEDENSELRSLATYIVSEMAQNNPFCQNYFRNENLIPIFVTNFQKAEDISKSSLQAVSALIRNYQPGLMEFVQIGGLNALLQCLNSSYSKVYVKATFLIASLSADTYIRDEFVKLNAIPILLNNLEPVHGFDIRVETTLYALSILCKSSDYKVVSRDTLLEAQLILKELINKNSNLPEADDIVTYSKEILTTLPLM